MKKPQRWPNKAERLKGTHSFTLAWYHLDGSITVHAVDPHPEGEYQTPDGKRWKRWATYSFSWDSEEEKQRELGRIRQQILDQKEMLNELWAQIHILEKEIANEG